MKEHPILFNGEMVRAILDGSKTQTRRVMKPQPEIGTECPYHIGEGNDQKARKSKYRVGDILYVRETWRLAGWDENTGIVNIDYKADGGRNPNAQVTNEDTFEKLLYQCVDDAEKAGVFAGPDGQFRWERGESPCRWRPNIHMFRWASRINLKVTNVRCERLQDISEADAIAEGVTMSKEMKVIDELNKHKGKPYWASFMKLWDSIYKNWDDNPWVWVYDFEVVK